MKKRSLLARPVVTLLTCMTLVAPAIAGCTAAEPSQEQERVLRVGTLYGSNDDSYFRQQYTDVFEVLNDNITIEIVPAIDQSEYQYYDYTQKEQPEQPDQLESVKKMLTGDNPVDVIIGDVSTMRSLIQENMLKQLDPLIAEDKFDTSDIVPTVLDGIKDIGDNSIYALTPTFSSSALFYNKAIFQKAGVEPPVDGSTWDDIFDKARRVTSGEGKDQIYGISLNQWGSDAFYDAQTYAAPLQLRTYDEKAEKMTVDNDSWEKVWSTISKLARDKVLAGQDAMNNNSGAPEVFNPFQGNLFMEGRAAMVIADYGYVTRLINDNKYAEKNEKFNPVEWDVVTPPVHQEKPGVGGNVYLSNLMAINSSAQNSDDAWEFIKFLNGEEWAKIRARSSYELVSRKSYIKPKEGLDYNIGAFYALKPIPPMNMNQYQLYQKMPNLWQVDQVGQKYFKQVLDNKKTPKEALAEWQKEGDEMLLKLQKDPKASFEDKLQ
ncbi:extracellular solute-binding protein [Paenibacillus gallinarum]|uniref:Extracellular solute-binding protein n=1 Tax=Paenibacillus gallinarum TaxID=2762232 RepID=A0ABR8SW03_9BACL|nr:extracellular solute-binding protein [Paenibacillus gallinarum]MBD7967681.1 extracellular solute-binding protein [Paenibacillus gallinarum]